MQPKPSSSSLPRTLVTIVVSLLVGLVLGNASTKSDLRHAREEIAKLKQDMSKRSESPTSLNSISSMLKLPQTTTGETRPRNRSPHRHSAPDAPSTPVVAVASTGSVPQTATGTVHTQSANRSLRKQLETATELWKTRSDLARNAFVSNVTTSDEQAVQFDVVMAAMNLRLSNSISTLVETVKKDQDVTPESGLRILSELSGDLVLAYNDLDRAMPPDWRKQAGSKFAVFDFINPEVVMPLAEVEDLANKGRARRSANTDEAVLP